MLCSNRVALAGAPSTCTLDTVLVPLPSFVFFVALAANAILSASKPCSKPVKWLHITHLVLLAAQIAMTVLELIRLQLQHLGLGLLPANTVGLIVAFVVLWRARVPGRTRVLLLIFAAYWFLLAVFEAIKVARLHQLERLDPTTSKTSNYPNSDWFLDNAVMLGIYVVFFCAETTTLLLSRRRETCVEDGYKMDSDD